jgi:hypothetical protein
MNYDYSSGMNYSASGVPEGVATGMVALLLGLSLIWLLFVLAIYVYFAICLMKIAKKTNTPNGWFAWIPILNAILMIQIAKKPIWWIILLFIPIVNIVISIILWMAIAEAVGKPNWLGILIIVPIANFIIPGYLAFSKMEQKTETPMASPPQTPPTAPMGMQ